MWNWLKSGLLMTAMMVLFLWIGRAVGGQSGMVIAFGLAVVMNVVSYWYSDKIVLAMYRARPVTELEAPQLVGMVRELAVAAGLPMPKVYIIPTAAPNAFATGRNPSHAAVAVTEGILDVLSWEELKGVLGHELAHIRHRDILVGTVAATFAGAIMMLASMARWGLMLGGFSRDEDSGSGLALLVAAIVAPLAAMLIQLAISRSREYMADASGARFAGDPRYLANALRKLAAANEARPLRQASPQTAHMFIVNPLKGGGWQSLFSTHPPMAERIRRLEQMAGR